MTAAAETQEAKLAERGVPRALGHLADRVLPETDFPTALLQFRRPFVPAAVKWKVQAEWGSGALVVGYIDVRLVIERLNLVWPWWNKDTKGEGQGTARCYLELFDPIEGRLVTRRSDVGQGGDPKTIESDAMKRAAVHLGIGVSVYALKQVRMVVGDADNQLRTEKKKKRNRAKELIEAQVPVIDQRTSDWLTAVYGRWLEVTGEPLFGPALDHGDEPDAQGLDTESSAAAAAQTGGEAPAADVDTSSVSEQIRGERADELRLLAQGLYGQLRQLKPKKLTPGVFQGKLQEAGATSLEALEALNDELEAMVREAGGGGA